MDRRWNSRLGIVLAVAVAVSACSDSSGPGSDALSPAASMEIAGMLMAEIMTIGFGVGFSDDGPAMTPEGNQAGLMASTMTFSETAPCAEGGNMLVEGSVTDNLSSSGTGTLVFDMRQRPNDCRVTTSEGLFTVNGDPDLTVAGDLAMTAGEMTSFGMTFGGAFRWNGGGSSGRCAMNVTYTVSSTFAVTASGTICGHSVNFTG